MRKSFILHIDSLGILDELTDEQAGQLFKLIAEYHNPNKPKQTQITQLVNLAFYSFKNQFERDIQKYDSIVERNRNNGKNGGRPKKENPNKPKKPDNKNNNKNNNDNKNKNINNNNNELILNDSVEFEILDELSFDLFWDLYDKKTGRENAMKLYNKLNKSDKEKIFNHIPLYKEAQPDKKYRKDPQTYLRNKSWNDEIIESKNDMGLSNFINTFNTITNENNFDFNN